jgi:hypothetical protein
MSDYEDDLYMSRWEEDLDLMDDDVDDAIEM